ncbi:serine hydrolase [Georgenia sp. Z1491]|uniref:serine hydrolase n=1 Tax=Georgenia sp. Z1491 TaxID=3416707 RepID=UPI003CF2A00A
MTSVSRTRRTSRPLSARRTAPTAVAALALVLAGCSGAGDDETGGEQTDSSSQNGSATDGPESSSGETPSGGETATDGEAPSDGTAEAVDPADHLTDPELLEQVEWALANLEEDAEGPEAADVEERFSDEMLAQIPAEQFTQVFAQLRSGAPYTVTAVAESREAMPTAELRLDSDAQPLIMTAVMGDDGRLGGLSFVPDTAGEAPDLGAWEDLDESLTEVGGESQVVVGSVSGGECTIEYTTEGVEDGGVPAPSGSVFKLVVLAALVDAVEAGEIAWEDELTITDELRSLPSGILQEREAGSTVTVTEAAELMISISDNTATDLLLDAVGQDRVAGAAEAAGLDTDRLLPLASTRDFFQLGWQVDDSVRAEFEAATSPEERQAVLDALPVELDIDPAAVTEPRWQEGVGWNLTGAEICSVHALLQEQAGSEAGGPVRDILSENPGVGVPDAATYQGFKGGSAPGVLAFSFYLEADGDDEGAGRVLVVQTRSDQAIDQMRATTIVGAGVGLLAEQ